jgi:hypothetical protein
MSNQLDTDIASGVRAGLTTVANDLFYFKAGTRACVTLENVTAMPEPQQIFGFDAIRWILAKVEL